MCWQVLPLIASAAGAGLQSKAQGDAQAAQAREVMRGQREQAALRDKASQRVNQRIQEVAKSDPAAEEAQAENDFAAALRRAKLARGGEDLNGVGGKQFRDDLGIARTQAEVEGKTLGKQLARIDAPQYQRFREGVGNSNAAVDLSLLGENSKWADFLMRMRAAGKTPDPILSGVGQGLTAYGMAASQRPAKKPSADGSLFESLPDQTPYYGVTS